MRPERVLITGAAGFLGSHLCDRLIDDGYHVIAMDNLSTGSLGNIEHHFGHERFKFVRQDVCEFVHVDGELDHILHFASPASPSDYLRMPIQTLKVSSLGTHNLLGLARVKQARILIASTSEIYGNPTVTPQTEEYWGNVNPVGPRGVYDEAKRFQEALTMAYHNVHGVDTRIARIFNTYGPRMRLRDGRVFPTFIRQALMGEQLSVYGDGSQTRSFCFVDDTIEALMKLMKCTYHLPINIGNPEEGSIRKLADEVLILSGKKMGMIFAALPQDDPQMRCPDISKAREILDWSPKTSRQIGLIKTYAYFEYLFQQAHN